MDDDDLLLPLPDMDGEDEEPPQDAEAFGDGLAADLVDEQEEVGLDASTAADEADDPARWLELPPEASEGGLSDEAGPELGLGDLIDAHDAAPPPLSAADAHEEGLEDHAGVDEAPPLGEDDGGKLGLEEPFLEGEGQDDDEVDLPGLSSDEAVSEDTAPAGP